MSNKQINLGIINMATEYLNSWDWTGTVEDRLDPQGLGRLKVRIHQYHSFNKSELPTADLPWAHVSYPVNSSRMVSAPKIGEMVHGKFMDGENARVPLVLGVIPGINTLMPSEESGAPVMPVDEVIITAGRPSTPPLSRGDMQYTSINKANKRLEHVCDISGQVDQAVAALKTFFGEVGQAIRKAINYILDALGVEPSGESKKLITIAKEINRKVKEFNKILKHIQDTAAEWIRIVRKIQAMIAYIRSLPEKWLKLFVDCLAKLYAQLAAGFKSLFADLDVSVSSDIVELYNEVQETQKAITETTQRAVAISTLPAQFAGALVVPSTQAEAETIGKDLTSAIVTETQTYIKDSSIKDTATQESKDIVETINPLTNNQAP